jgi:predicted nucleotidyltransferase
MLLTEIHQQKKAIESLANQYGALSIRLFGSVARCEEREDSDIDFLVKFPQGYDLFKQRIPLTQQLQQLLKRKVDLIPEHELNKHLRETILAEAVEL